MSYRYDHRQLADEMEIYFFDEDIGAGLPIWLPNGVAIRDQLEDFMKNLEHRHGYQRVVSPHLGGEKLYEKSGHLQFFKENMFPPLHGGGEQRNYYLKPMNCPHHHKVFSALPRSYRGLPLRIAEYGQVYRHEPSGSLRGISRARGLCQNDAHIYVERDGSLAEIIKVLELHELCYKKIGLAGYRYRLSLRDVNRPQDFQGPDEHWREAEDVLRQALVKMGLNFFEAIGEAAFYGPKIDVQMRMGGNAEESIASVQLDFLSAERFDLSYISSAGVPVRPWIVHRAPLGSHERFVALLLEYFDGQLAGWLAPVQLMILPMSEAESSLVLGIEQELRDAGLRVRVDDSQGSLSKRLVFAHRIRPFAKVVVGRKEAAGDVFKLQLRDGERSCGRNEIARVLSQLCARP